MAVVEAKTSAEKRAAALATDAMGKDFLKMAYDVAEKKLRQAIQWCEKKECSVPFTARLHRDLGVLYVAGLAKVEEGKDEFMAALVADGTVAIQKDMLTPEVDAAFMEIKGGLNGDSVPNKNATRRAPKVTLSPDDKPLEDPPEPEPGAWQDLANWISLGIQQDFMLHQSAKNVCNNGSDYKCYDGAGTPQNLTNRRIDANTNQIGSLAPRMATTRVLIGFDRLLTANVGVGLRAGLAFAGKAIKEKADPAFHALHLELRGTYYFGSSPFSPDTKLRPYVHLSVGYAEVDSKITIDVTENDQSGKALKGYRLAAWKRAQKFFGGLGVGALYALGRNHGPFLEGRYMQMLGGTSAPVLALQLGYSYGF